MRLRPCPRRCHSAAGGPRPSILRHRYSARLPTPPPAAVIAQHRAGLVIVAGNTLGARDALILDCRLEDRAGLHLADDAALHFLPRGLVVRIDVAAGGHERLMALL